MSKGSKRSAKEQTQNAIVSQLIRSAIEASIAKFDIKQSEFINVYQVHTKDTTETVDISIDREFDEAYSDEIRMDFWHSMLSGLEVAENWHADVIGDFILRIDEVDIISNSNTKDPRVIIGNDNKHLLFLPNSKRITVVSKVQKEVKPKSYKRWLNLLSNKQITPIMEDVLEIQENINLENIQRCVITVLS